MFTRPFDDDASPKLISLFDSLADQFGGSCKNELHEVNNLKKKSKLKI